MINIRSHSGIHTLEAEQVLPITTEEAWTFFSAPANLGKITPAYMGFQITSGNTDTMYPGQIITYRIGLAPGVKSNWITEITHVAEGRYFVDEQRFGPYAFWHHQHWFASRGEATHMLDRVSYKLPFGPIGRLLHPFIKRQLISIFTYRYDTLARLFPVPAPHAIDPHKKIQIA